jgi:hypothetical protein
MVISKKTFIVGDVPRCRLEIIFPCPTFKKVQDAHLVPDQIVKQRKAKDGTGTFFLI